VLVAVLLAMWPNVNLCRVGAAKRVHERIDDYPAGRRRRVLGDVPGLRERCERRTGRAVAGAVLARGRLTERCFAAGERSDRSPLRDGERVPAAVRANRCAASIIER
jgi:hypothetical protein